MEARAVPAAWRVDPVGDGDGRRDNVHACGYCARAASEREGMCAVIYAGLLSDSIHLQREDEQERRRASHHINFDAL